MNTLTRTLPLIVLLLPFTISAQKAQNNLGFESWGQNALMWTVPEGFPLSYDASENTADPYAGSSALKITSAYNSSFGDTLGVASNGAIVGSSFVPGEQYTKRPDSLSGYIRTNIHTLDSAAMFYRLTRYDSVGDSTQLVGSAGAFLPDTIGSWTRVSVDFSYENSKTPDTLTIQYATHTGDQASRAGSVLEADEFQLHTSTTTSIEKETANASFSIYPNPSDGRFQVKMDRSMEGNLEIRDLNGRLMKQQSINGDDRSDVRMQDVEKGVYFVNIRNESGESVAVKKVMITR